MTFRAGLSYGAKTGMRIKQPIGRDAQRFAARLSQAAGIEPEIRRGAARMTKSQTAERDA